MRRAFILSCVALVTLAALNLWMWRKFTQEREDAAALRAALAHVHDTSSPPPRSETPATARVELVSGSHVAATAPAQPALEATPPSSGNVVKQWQDRERQMLGDTEYREAWRRSARDQLAPVRADALRVVGMTSEQADRVIDLWVDRNLWLQEHGDFTRGGTVKPDYAPELKQRNDTEQAELLALLGERTYAAWTEYLRTTGERAEANLLNRQLSTDANPLDAAQVDALVVALSAERDGAEAAYREYRQTRGASDPYADQTREDRRHYVELVRAANRHVHDRMAGTLSTAQLDKLDALLASRLLPIETQLRLEAKTSP